jgi:DNA-binding CsgD family transcriptional regulator
MAGLLERESEMEKIRAALGGATGGKGGAMAIMAAAGLGKTRLLRGAREAGAETGCDVVFARATELERDFPFALVRQLFEARLADLPIQEREGVLDGATAARGALGYDPAPGDTDDPFAVLHGLYWVTAALSERSPLLLAIDDVHWADPASVDYVNFLLPRLEELPVLLVVTLRPDDPTAPPNLGRVLTDPTVKHLSPGPLGREAAGELLAQELGQGPDLPFAEACHEMSGGNPFLLSELARHLRVQGVEPTARQVALVREQTPEQVSRTVLGRIAGLSAEAGRVARALAVLGDGSDLSLLAAMDGSDPEVTQRAADELRASYILDESSPPRFIHPLVRNAVYTDIPVGERSRAHARAAELLRSREADLERVATQLLATEARGDAATAETLLEAGERALAAGAPGSSIAYLTRALREPAPAEVRIAVLDPLLTASLRAADQVAFAEIEAEILAEWARNPTVRSRWATELTMLMSLAGRFEEAATLLQEAVEVATAEDDLERVYQLQAQLSTLAAIVPTVPEVTLVDHGGRVDPDSRTGRLVAAMEARAAINGGTAAEAVEAAKRALANEGSIFAEEPEITAAPFAVMVLTAADEVDAAQHGADRALAIATERGATPELAGARFLNGFVAWGRGDLVTAEADMRHSVDLAFMAGILPLVLTWTGPLMEVLIERDELDAAEAQLQAVGLAEGYLPPLSLGGIVLMIRGHLRFEQGDLARAIEDFEPLMDESVTSRMGYGPAGSAVPFWARALMALGRKDEARRLADELMPQAYHLGNLSAIAHVMRAVAVSRGGAEGVEMLEEAVELVSQTPRRLEQAHALADLGEALRRSGRRADARVPLREAFDLARRCGAARIARRANAELEATGQKVRRYAPIGVESLTPSERRVADMAASGMINRQIAQSLFVTVKTVEAHLSATYDKLDIGSRRELPAALGSEDPSAT